MNKILLQHRSGTIDACPCGDGKISLRLRTGRGDASSVTVIYTCNKYTWHQNRSKADMQLTLFDSDFDYYTCVIPLSDTRFAYIFEITDKAGESMFFSEQGVTDSYRHDLAYFSYFQYTSMFQTELMRVHEWIKSAVAYQIFPERFYVGNTSTDKSYVNKAWGDLPNPDSFYGGDLWGIVEKLPYLRELGVRLLYLTPVFISPSNHKYDIVDYESVDLAFGGKEALHALISSAHACGMRVMLDGVFNHCSDQHPFFLDVKARGHESEYYDWFFVDGGRPSPKLQNYKTFASVPYMPKLNTGNPAVIEYFCKVGSDWITKYGADGWRLDVSDELSHTFLREFRRRIIAAKSDAIIIGEDWHDASRYLNGDEYDGVMNYAFTKACLDLLKFGTIDPQSFCDRLVRLYMRANDAANRKMLNLLDSHDTERFLSRVDGDAIKHRAALALLFFYPGIPCVYYGDEIGLMGGYDPDSRRCFDWNQAHWDKKSYLLVKRLMHLRQGDALSNGMLSITQANGVITIIRRTEKARATLMLNATDETLSVTNTNKQLTLTPYEFIIEED